MADEKEYKEEELTPPDTVDYFIYRTDIAREHSHAIWWRNTCIGVFLVLVLVVCYYNWRESQFEDVKVEQQVEQSTDQGGNNTNTLYTGDYYGETESNDYSNGQTPEDGRG